MSDIRNKKNKQDFLVKLLDLFWNMTKDQEQKKFNGEPMGVIIHKKVNDLFNICANYNICDDSQVMREAIDSTEFFHIVCLFLFKK